MPLFVTFFLFWRGINPRPRFSSSERPAAILLLMWNGTSWSIVVCLFQNNKRWSYLYIIPNYSLFICSVFNCCSLILFKKKRQNNQELYTCSGKYCIKQNMSYWSCEIDGLTWTRSITTRTSLFGLCSQNVKRCEFTWQRF